jgi:glutamyl-tRNA reductase
MKLLAKGESAEKVLEHLSHRLTNKLLHAPTQALNLADGAERNELQSAASRLFHLHAND